MQKLLLPLLANYHLPPTTLLPLILGYTLQFTISVYHPCSTSSCHAPLKAIPSFQLSSPCLDFIERASFFPVLWVQGYPSTEPHSSRCASSILCNLGIPVPLLLLPLPVLAHYCWTTHTECLKHIHINNLELLLQKLLLVHFGDDF